ncbi:MAG: mycothiol transferase [Acidimicrobiia bacterium]
MTSAELLIDAFGRIRPVVHDVVDGLTAEQLSSRIDDDANSIAWLVWHLSRIQDDHIADAAETAPVWTAAGWAERFGFPFDVRATGFGQSSDEVAAVRVDDGALLVGYFDAVHDHTTGYLADITDADLDRIVDDAWDPPVSLGVRLVSVVEDDLQHAGQAAYVRGIVERAAEPGSS